MCLELSGKGSTEKDIKMCHMRAVQALVCLQPTKEQHSRQSSAILSISKDIEQNNDGGG